MTLTKAKLIDSTRQRAFMSRPEAVKAVKTLLEIIKKSLDDGEDVLISGCGEHCLKRKRKGEI